MYIHRDNARNIGGFVYICRMRIYDMNSMRALWCKKKKKSYNPGIESPIYYF